MQTIYIDQARYSFAWLETVPVTDEAGLQLRDRTGSLRWRARCLVRPIGNGSRPEVSDIGLTGPEAPGTGWSTLSEVSFSSLRARYWEAGDRSGVSLSADAMNPVSPARPAPAPAKASS